ncbi:DUF3566 domain-containing protein [bacterium]|nr:DUF3566 domain-containing protein [bacterium]MBU1636138.1 DUF3566 domain-containing protein [bacterium]MBU1920766.1 DUF3566 domain-containing protein [bacterium]
MIRELKRIEPKSVVRIAFFIGLLCGFLFGVYSSFVLSELTTMLTTEESAALKGLTGGSTLMTGVMMGLTGSLFFSLMGWFLAVVYNFLAGKFGGIEFMVNEMKDSEPEHPTSAQSRNDDE